MSATKTKTLYITKYALTSGVIAAPAEQCDFDQGKMYYRSPSGYLEVYRGNEWQLTQKLAIHRVKQMKANEIERLEYKLKELRAFDAVQACLDTRE